MSEKVKVTINGVTSEFEKGVSVLDAAKELGVRLNHMCFGNAICNTCRVNVIEGADSLSPREMKETVSLNYHLEFRDEVRLACQAKLQGPNPVVVEPTWPFNWLKMPDDKKRIQAIKEGRSPDANE